MQQGPAALSALVHPVVLHAAATSMQHAALPSAVPAPPQCLTLLDRTCGAPAGVVSDLGGRSVIDFTPPIKCFNSRGKSGYVRAYGLGAAVRRIPFAHRLDRRAAAAARAAVAAAHPRLSGTPPKLKCL